MTRFLSDSLQAPEPFFRIGLNKLEAANGHPNSDIRLSTEVMRATQAKLRRLGLDPYDTTAEELYHGLLERVKADDALLVKTLRALAATYVSAEGEVVAGMIHALKELPESQRTFALKPSSFKAIIKQLPPKKAMKLLGYRSLSSFLKHESSVSILAAARLAENNHWQQRLLDQYKKLKPSDFEDRNITLLQPESVRWRQLAEQAVASDRHNLICLDELGALVFLPLPKEMPPGTVTASLGLALQELNDIRASGTYLKLCQVRPDFGQLVQTVVAEEPQLNSHLLDMSVPWQLIQRYYAGLKQFGQELNEPHLQLEDLAWHPVEKTLAKIEPSLAFWQGSAHLGLLHGGHPVSLNLLDTALSCCNQLPFERRLVHFFQRSLWQELLLGYFKPDSIEQTVLRELQPRLVEETVAL
ncbi:MAG TPA: hypothetical protein VH234_03940 [Candidatus Saccharimonadales bacterium]|jgi:hypothetical protein|nr:hypothetical protein [Candidatus Saccharimonadales bacterium]